jgi:hypothetical protein
MASVVIGIASVVGMTVGTTGCSMDPSGTPPAQPLPAQLADPAPLPFDMDSSTIRVNGVELPLVSGQVELGAYYYQGNVVELDAVDVAFDTMVVSGQTPAIEGYELHHARVSLERPVVAPVEWSELGDAGFASLRVDLLLDWSVVSPKGVEIALATQHLRDVPVELDLYTGADGSLNAVLSGTQPGKFWSWAGVASMRDLHFDLRAQRLPIVD